MTCKGSFYQNDNNNNNIPGPEVFIKFTNENFEAHVHLATSSGNVGGPTSVKYPHFKENTQKPEILNMWISLVEQCKKSVEKSDQWQWTLTSFFEAPKPFPYQGPTRSVQAFYNGDIPPQHPYTTTRN